MFSMRLVAHRATGTPYAHPIGVTITSMLFFGCLYLISRQIRQYSLSSSANESPGIPCDARLFCEDFDSNVRKGISTLCTEYMNEARYNVGVRRVCATSSTPTGQNID